MKDKILFGHFLFQTKNKIKLHSLLLFFFLEYFFNNQIKPFSLLNFKYSLQKNSQNFNNKTKEVKISLYILKNIGILVFIIINYTGGK